MALRIVRPKRLLMYRSSCMRFILFFFSILLALPSFGDIQKTQVYLNDLGYPAGSVDGLWGKKTEQALLDFLQDQKTPWDGKLDTYEENLLEKVWFKENTEHLISINRTTSRHFRARYSCTIAKSIDTLSTGAFDRNLSDHLFAFADLNSDQKLDLIQGFEEEPYDTSNIREPVNYKVFMSDGSQFPKNLPNLVARKILVQDFNLDEMDDLVFLNAGPHKPPRPGLTNRILISGDEGYSFKELPGGSKISHGGAAGDLDRDGDVDIIVANGQQEDVQILVNLGNGSFKSITLYAKFPGQPYTAEIWDVDQDGLLDIIFGVPAKGIYVSYGKLSKPDSPQFSSLRNYTFSKLKDRLPLDFAFDYDISGGLSEIIVLDTRLGPNSYRGWGINKLNINRNREAELSDVFDFDPGDNYHWNAWIDICDLDGDGKPELVSNKIGRNNLWALDNPKQIVWQFENNWIQVVYPRGKPVSHGHVNSTPQQPASSEELLEVSNEIICTRALDSGQWILKSKYYTEAKKRNLNIKKCRFYSQRLLPKKPDGTIASKQVCENAVDGKGWNNSQPLWVAEAKNRNLSLELCAYFKAQ